jgi:hypothetical protein
MSDTTVFRRASAISSFMRSSASSHTQVEVLPCALVYIDVDGNGSPNCKSRNVFCYVDQAITLNRSLLAAGLPRLNVATNVPEEIKRYLEAVEPDRRPHLLRIYPSITLPKSTRFYSAHFKLDLLEQVGATLHPGVLLMLMDTDMIALGPLNRELLRRCHAAGVGAFDISDQEFSAYGDARVTADLETVAGKPLMNPRWFGGELLLANGAFIEELVRVGRSCFERYREALGGLNHQGDEAFISATLNLLAERGHHIIDVGAYRLVGRHWSGNTHRDLRWFKGCSLLHLSGCKKLLEQQARCDAFSTSGIWHRLVVMHTINRIILPLKRRARANKKQAFRPVSLVDVVLLECDAKRLSNLASRISSLGASVMCAVTQKEALDACGRLHPLVVVVSTPLPVAGAVGMLDALRERAHPGPRPFTIAQSTDDSSVDWAGWDRWLLQSTDLSEIVRVVARTLGK